MRCHPPKGKPAPAISWLQNDRPINPTSDKNFIVTGEGHLIVVAARLSDTNNYTCVAENVASKRFSDPATITVYGKNLFVPQCYKIPYETSLWKDSFARAGHQGSFTSASLLKLTGIGRLIVVAARLSNTNYYTCVAKNVASKRFSDPCLHHSLW